MKIFLINQEHAHFSGPGGAERSVQSIAEYFASAGHQVVFAAMARRIYMRDMPANGIHSIRMINGVKTILMGRTDNSSTHAELLMPVILAENPDIIHTNVFHKAPQLWQALAPLGIPVLHTLREYKLMCDQNLFDGEKDCGQQCTDCSVASQYALDMSRYVQGVVGISRFTLRRHIDRGFFADASVQEVIPNSYRAKEVIPPRAAPEEGRPLRLGFLGRLHASKGINLIIDAIAALPPESVTLVMAGDLQDEKIAARIEALSKVHDARYLGFRDPTDFFSQIDVLIAPSIWHEPFGRITIESFAHRVPVIVTDRGGLPDIIADGKTGWVFDPDEPDALARLITQVAALPRTTITEMGNQCWEAATKYTPDQVGERYLAAYDRVISSKAAAQPAGQPQLRQVLARDANRLQILRRMKTNISVRNRRPLKVVVVTGQFPKLSETFVLNHITGLIDHGHDARVLYTRPEQLKQIPADYIKYGLHDRATSLEATPYQTQTTLALARPARVAASKLATAAARMAGVDDNDDPFLTAQDQLQRAEERLHDYRIAQVIAGVAADADIVHCHFGHRPKMMFKYMDLKAFHAPIVCSFHGIDVSAHIQKHGPTLYDDIKRRLHKALPVSDFFRKRLISLGYEPKDVQVHHVGIDTTKFTYAGRRRSEGEALRIVSVGRLVPKKGFLQGVEGIARAIEQRPDLRIDYRIAGDGIEREAIQAVISTFGLEGVVTLLGALPHEEVTRLMSASHVMLAPSVTGVDGDMEGIPTVTMEAMASGLPVLSTYHSGIPEAVLHGYTGLLSPEADADALAANIIHLYDNPDLGPRFGRQGRAHVELEFNIQRQNAKICELYQRIVSGEED